MRLNVIAVFHLYSCSGFSNFHIKRMEPLRTPSD